MIKYLIHSKKWRDRVNGNTYHAAPFQYGYGEQFIQSASEVMIKNGWIKEKLKGLDFQEIHIIDQDDCKKKEVEKWGQS